MEVPISTEEKSSKIDKTGKVSQPSTLAIKPQQQFPVNSGSLSGANASSAASASIAAASAASTTSTSVAAGKAVARQRPRGSANPGGIKAVPIPPLPSPNQPKAGKLPYLARKFKVQPFF